MNNINTYKPEVYVARVSEGIDKALEGIATTPETPLSLVEKEQLLEYEKLIISGVYKKSTDEIVGDWYKTKSKSVNFIVDYFETEGGRNKLNQFVIDFGLQINICDKKAISASRVLAEISFFLHGNPEMITAFEVLAGDTHRYFADLIYDENGLSKDPTHFIIHTNPESIIGSIKDIGKVRENLRLARKDVYHREDISKNLKEAMIVLTDIYMQKTAERLGELYPDFVDIYQLCMTVSSGEEREALLRSLHDVRGCMYVVAEKLYQSQVDEESDISERFAWTMDHWRNGVVYGLEDTTMTDDLAMYAEQMSRSDNYCSNIEQARFTSEEVEKIQTVDFTAQEVSELAKHILRQNGILSISDDYAMGEWPLDSSPENPKIGVKVGQYSNLTYSRGWILIPEKLKRKGFQQSPSGAILVVAHEIEHAIDGITHYRSSGLKLAEITTRGSSAVREGIGKAIEIKMSNELIGQEVYPSLTYYKAMKVWLETGNEVSAIYAFAQQAAIESGLDSPTRDQIINAQNRIQRIIGKHGLNSKALVYIEQALIAERINNYDEYTRGVVSGNSGYDLNTQALLNRYGLLSMSRYSLSKSMIDCIEEFIRVKYLSF